MIYLVSDHGGFRKKQRLVQWLTGQGYAVRDLGPSRLSAKDDYPVWAARIARVVQRDPKTRGIMLCRTGVGMAIVANKFDGIRAAQGSSIAIARASRKDENTNVLSLAADHLSDKQLQAISQAWLNSPYRPMKRYARRLRQIARIEHAN